MNLNLVQFEMELAQPNLVKVSFIGPRPFITYDPIGGSDFRVMGLLGEKFHFTPIYAPEKSYHTVKSNGTYHGLEYVVGGRYYYTFAIYNFDPFSRFQVNRVR